MMDHVIVIADSTSLWQMLLGAFSIGIVVGTGFFYFKFLSKQVQNKNIILWFVLMITILLSYVVLVIEFWNAFNLVDTRVISITWLIVLTLIGVFFSYFVSSQLRKP